MATEKATENTTATEIRTTASPSRTDAATPSAPATEIVQKFTDGNFDEKVLKSGVPVLVDFWAAWCGPCKRLAPTVDALAAEYAGKIVVGKLDVDENQNVSFKYQVRGIPTLLLFKGGQVVESVVGLAQKDDLKKVLDKHI